MNNQPENTSVDLSRRTLLKSGLAFGAAGTMASCISPTLRVPARSPSIKLKKGDVVLFQGDSITDAGRKKDKLSANQSDALGRGYAAMIAGAMLSDYADLDLQFYNRGISGNKVPDLAGRWEEDTIKLNPAVLSIMIGVNDLWHTVAFGAKYKGTIEDYEVGYRQLLKQTFSALPKVRIIICEPFELRSWPALDPYRAAAKKLADEMNLTFVSFHSMFKKAAEKLDGKFWAWDGIHPTIPGHTLMLAEWRKAVGV